MELPQPGYEVSIAEIKSSVNETRRISKMVQDIALQSNSLTLNLSAEAAKTEDCIGLSIVADEIRGLDAKCQEAAEYVSNTIQDLICKFDSFFSADYQSEGDDL
ncbi:MAG: methyl-accepting chemotaxis protein [Defluviitaleaceae bacterium]|nr:methyl-accepting chemotaxis protein [Defluviitaleaceae bacterium]